MGILDLFDSRDKKKRLSHIKNLIALASADGHVDDEELALIFKIGSEIGLTREELNRIISRPESINFIAPSSFRERIEQLYDMVLVMMIDGEIHKNEVAFCKFIAMRLGFRPEVIDAIVNEVIESIAKGLAFDLIISDLESKFD